MRPPVEVAHVIRHEYATVAVPLALVIVEVPASGMTVTPEGSLVDNEPALKLFVAPTASAG